MGRRRRGRPISGWLIVDKPAGIGSTDTVSAVRRALDARKAGHAGTLDPAATGVLAVALGEATKTVPYVTDARKAYRFTVRFGAATDTDDAEGAVIQTAPGRPSDDEIRAALPALTGDILQVPPAYSAVKIDGARAYDRARQGEAVALAARPLHVESLEMLARPDRDHAEFEMVCGKGGYVRSVARDLGRALGCLGHVSALRRIWSGPFDLAQAVTLDAVRAAAPGPGSGDAASPGIRPDALERHLLPLQAGLADLPELPCTESGALRLRNGNPGEVTLAPPEQGMRAWASHRGQPLAVGRYLAGRLHPDRVFNLAPDISDP